MNVGDVVNVTGFARERFNQTTINLLNSDTSAVLPANIVNCGSGSVAMTDVAMPFAAAGFPERYEGMLVRFPQSLVISEYFNYARFGEIVLALPLDGEPRPFTGTAIDEPGAAANARTLANSLRRITLDDAQSAQNPPFLRHPNGLAFSLSNRFRGGDTVENAVGVLGFDFSLYRIYPTGPANVQAGQPATARARARRRHAARGGDEHAQLLLDARPAEHQPARPARQHMRGDGEPRVPRRRLRPTAGVPRANATSCWRRWPD